MATKQGWLLYEGGHRVPEQQHLYGTYILDVTGSLCQIAKTHLQMLIPLPTPS